MKILATMKKEWLLLWRDKIGLVILFILPMCLVLFISLTSTVEGNNPSEKLDVLFLNADQGAIGTGFKKALDKVDLFKIIEEPDSRIALSKIKSDVLNGRNKVAIVIPADTTKNLSTSLEKQLRGSREHQSPKESIQLFLDPGLPIEIKNSVTTALSLISADITSATLAQLLSQTIHQPNLKLNYDLLHFDTTYLSLADHVAAPNSVQYNVPAWTLFGMFFIVIPVAGGMVRERELGLFQRLEIAPVWHLNLLLGRILAFVALNLVQLWLMLAVGVYILPMFGLPVLEVANHIGIIFITGICASLAATGFGLLIGTWAETYEQATVLAPFVIVIAAAIGGIMAPVDLMPHALQSISGLSPLNWAQTAFVDIFVRDANLHQIMPELAKLVLFFVAMLLLSLSKAVHFAGLIKGYISRRE
ncbi:MAG: ABC transporter permease [Legionellales bacterium]|nr:ABC transporter permease [Legionellales bacterium]